MEFRIEEILWYLIFIDSVFANLIIWLFPKWYEKNKLLQQKSRGEDDQK